MFQMYAPTLSQYMGPIYFLQLVVLERETKNRKMLILPETTNSYKVIEAFATIDGSHEL